MKNDVKEILAFLVRHQVATVCGNDGGLPFCFNCFYGYMEASSSIVFKSATDSRQATCFTHGTPVAGTILTEGLTVHNNAGVRFEGRVVEDEAAAAEKAFYKCFPVALLIPGKIIQIQLNRLFFTRTNAGFRSKASWFRES